ncbi:hypothetical protein [Brevundimonas abyssalis]|uniref:Uncharacterized protein n=1 Tax=Brevundimonas abyssalis TAR-001 TaxID=1391729 RepID=A0A8E0TSJ5_9CAUL|nr:hypothetical protein [Brevundimonas abyssalis]GAD59381.1 hypothetical protein MBEBAB_1631 [Brevundimonas abyssalis TAR-001]
MKLWAGAAAALLLLGSSPAVAQPAQEPEISAEDIAAASAIPDAFLVRLRSGNGAAAIGQAFAGTMMEYQNAQLQALITYLNTLTDYYGPVTGWELGRQEAFTSRWCAKPTWCSPITARSWPPSTSIADQPAGSCCGSTFTTEAMTCSIRRRRRLRLRLRIRLRPARHRNGADCVGGPRRYSPWEHRG